MEQENEKLIEMPWTGERYVPTVHGDIELEHLHRYAFARGFSSDKDVLDIASGEGYGTNFLAKNAKSVIGVDLSQEAIEHAIAKYRAPNVKFQQGDCTAIPLSDNSVDVVVSFETIEHHDRHEAMLAEIRRVLRPDGVLIISTPDRDVIRAFVQQRNEFHVKELGEAEFRKLLANFFKNVFVLEQRVRYGSLLMSKDQCRGGGFKCYSGSSEEITIGVPATPSIYMIAVASNCWCLPSEASFFEGTESISGEISLMQTELKRLLVDRDVWANEVRRIKSTFSWKITKPLRLLGKLPRLVQERFKPRREL